MEWYNILTLVLGAFGGIGGFVSIYKAKPERTSIEVQNMKEMLNESHRMYEEMKAEKEAEQEDFKAYKEENMKYVAEFKARFNKLERRLDAAENVVFRLKGAIYQAYRCTFAPKTEDCPVLNALEKNSCEDCMTSAGKESDND